MTKKQMRNQIFIVSFILALTLLAPIPLSRIWADAWREISWERANDLMMLEWTGAFLQIFLCLLVFEQYRQTEKIIFSFLSCGFLAMGIINFSYALSPVGTNLASFLKLLAFIIPGICFIIGTIFKNKTDSDLSRTIFRYIVPTFIIALVAAIIPRYVHQALPKLIIPETGGTTLTATLAFLVPGALFFYSATIWLHLFIKNRSRENLLLTITLLIFAQISIILHYSKLWGMLWWGLHVGAFLAILLSTLYLLIVSVRRSLVWRLLLSLALTFGLTVIIASAIIQSYSDKLFQENSHRMLHAKQKQLLQKVARPIVIADEIESQMKAKVDKLGLTKFVESNKEHSECREYNNESIINAGLVLTKSVPYQLVPFIKEDASMSVEVQKQLSRIIAKSRIDSSWHRLDVDSKHSSILVAKLKKNSYNGEDYYSYITVDLASLKKMSLLSKSHPSSFEGRVIISSAPEKVYTLLTPGAILPEGGDDNLEKVIITKLTVASLNIDKEGLVSEINIHGANYLLLASNFPGTNWTAFDIIPKSKVFGSQGYRSKYFFAATGMATLLLGFIALLLLLNFQLATPLKKLLIATNSFEDNSFNYKIDSKSPNELGIVSRSFDNMTEDLDLTYKKLQQSIEEKSVALKEVEKAHRSQSIFFANLSHELRTPLHGILSFSRFGMDRERIKNTEKAAEYFSQINRSGERLIAMINELLDLSRLEAGYVELNLAKASVFLAAIHAYEEMKASFSEKHVEFSCSHPEFNVTANIDRERIIRVYHNLLSNALNYAPENSVINMEITDRSEHLLITISDSGPGIDECDLKNVFQKFTQVGENANKVGSTGLGLSICQEIIHLHKGDIWAENRPEGGLKISFTIHKNL